jgi:Putative sensor
MISSIDAYLGALRKELRGADRALVQDAIADAREYLSSALSVTRDSGRESDEASLLQTAIAAFGTPADIALAYREVERRTPIGTANLPERKQVLGRFLSVYGDTRTWSSLLYMALAVIVGYGYLMWMIFGIAFSVTGAIFIVGLPLILAFLFSIRGLALLEGRLVEALLGVRMPRRRVFFPRGTNWRNQLKALVTDRHTWLTMFYASSLWSAGVAYFVLITVCTTLSFTLIATPVLQEWLGVAVLALPGGNIQIPRWAYPIPVISGFLLWTGFLHLCRAVGRVHGQLAKSLLVSEAAEP